jgi:hypothetical protein
MHITTPPPGAVAVDFLERPVAVAKVTPPVLLICLAMRLTSKPAVEPLSLATSPRQGTTESQRPLSPTGPGSAAGSPRALPARSSVASHRSISPRSRAVISQSGAGSPHSKEGSGVQQTTAPSLPLTLVSHSASPVSSRLTVRASTIVVSPEVSMLRRTQRAHPT